MPAYGQFCPISKAAEVLCERWTLLLIREMLMGSKRFNEMQRGLAKMSPSLLTKRLKELEEANLLHRTKISGQKGYEYHLSSAGRELAPLVMEMAKWGLKWVSDNIPEDDLDIELLMWDIQRNIKTHKLPQSNIVLKFHFVDGLSLSDWWVIIENKEVDLCTDNPGKEIDLYINADARSLTQIWMGELSWKNAEKEKKVSLLGDSLLKREIAQWLGSSNLAALNPRADR